MDVFPKHFYRSLPIIGQGDAVREAGKVARQLWKPVALEKVRDVAEYWIGSPNRAGREGERHLFTPDEEEASLLAFSLSRDGYEVKRLPVPADAVAGWGAAGSEVMGLPAKATHWIAARAGGNEISRLIVRRFEEGLKGSVPPVFQVDGKSFDGAGAELSEALFWLFGMPVSPREVSLGFAADLEQNVKGFRLEKLILSRCLGSAVSIFGAIASSTGEVAGKFEMVLPQAPLPGQVWLAEGDGTAIFGDNRRRGVGRFLYASILGFLYRLGVDAFDMRANQDGRYVWPHLGFDFQKSGDREAAKTGLRDYLIRNGIHLSEEKERELARVRHAWEISDFRTEEGIEAGKEFLFEESRLKNDVLLLRFRLQPDYPGWRLLLKTGG